MPKRPFSMQGYRNNFVEYAIACVQYSKRLKENVEKCRNFTLLDAVSVCS